MKSWSDASLHAGQSSASFVALLRRRAVDQADRLAYRFLLDGETDEAILTYAELDRKAKAIAAQLQLLQASGERALLLFQPGLDCIAAFFGCLYARVIAVPAYPPRRNRTAPRLSAIVADSQASLVLTTAQLQARFEPAFTQDSNLQGLRWLSVDSLPVTLGENWQQPALTPDTTAFLQYTSGSTGVPKGVVLSHGNLLHNSALIADAFGATSETRGLSWLPPYHDMGLIGGILQPVFLGCPVTLLAPMSFLQQPFRWLQAISRFKATISGAPNFAYELCVQRITPAQKATLDLSSWTLAFNGAEPVRPETLDQFSEAFAECGFRREIFYPCYGLAEATLIVSGGQKSVLPTLRRFDCGSLAKTLVGCGQALAGQKIAIVNPESRQECSAGEVGEIWISGPSVAGGYWNRPQQTEETFRARLASTNESPWFLRTEDLGFQQDGELFITGRLKDLIIIRGANHYPQDIELTVEKSHPALRPGCGAAFSVEVDGEERLVIVQELERHHPADIQMIVSAIREAVFEQHELEAHAVLLLRSGTIPKTSSGKVQRHLCRAGCLADSLDTVATVYDRRFSSIPEIPAVTDRRYSGDHTAASIQDWLVTHLATRLGTDPKNVDVHQPFAQYGLDSATAVRMSGELEEWLGRRLSPTLVWEYPTVRALARHLAGEAPSATSYDATLLNVSSPVEPIAIIGIGCRFPGAGSVDAFWQLLREGVDAITEVPRDRWDPNTLRNLNLDGPSEASVRRGGFLPRVDEFDAPFFGISAREAERMDPQQRLLLEVTWEALADAGQIPERLSGTHTAVFVGISNDDYGRMQLDSPEPIDPFTCTGNALSVAANRISYLLNLRGPSMAIDTACSASLVAVHLACQSLWNNESSMALAGGVNLILAPWVTLNFSRSGFMSSDGRCKAFDAKADGYVRGEGCGVVVLKPLSRAIADGDAIHAVIRGSAVNQDGRSNGLTAPNPEAQEEVLREAYRRARIAPAQVQYVEAHGTGTYLGDPIEAKALGSVLATGRKQGNRCAIGSVKTNIGHLESAAGIAGLIKVALSLKHRAIPASLHFQEPNPHIPFDTLPLRVQNTFSPWPEDSEPAIAGVSSFGFGGTNAHVVLGEAPRLSDVEATVASSTSGEPLILALSAHTADALKSIASEYKHFLEQNQSTSLHDVCYTADARRAHYGQRLALVGRTRDEFIEKLDAFMLGQNGTHAGTETKLESLCNRYVQGENINFDELFAQRPRPVPLPPYPWQRERYWINTEPLTSEPQPQSPPKTAILRQLEQAMPNERRELLLDQIQKQVAKVLGRAPSTPLDPYKPLNELGLDSLMAVELRNALVTATGSSLPATFLFEYPTIDSITTYIVDQVLVAPKPPVADSHQSSVGAVYDRPSHNEPVAIIGIGCRFPGGANDPESFWRLLRNGVDAITEVPSHRWNVDSYYDPDPSVPGKMNSRYGGFLKDVDRFDSQFFGIAPREASAMDPQQRLLLEVSWEALEQAGQAPDKLDGSPTGVFIGISNSDYFQLVQDPAGIDAYISSGNALSVAAGRLSYTLGLQGPSLAIDTACSSSLVSVHLACQSLHAGESRMALAGGVNLVLSPKSTIAISELRMLSPDGRCKTFDASANGFVRGEGCGIVVLKRLSDAIQDGDNILALILGSAVNQDGRSGGLTAPNGRAQEAVIRTALTAGSVSPAAVHYVEAHGTGTALGDPIEVRALAAVFSEGRRIDDPLIIGSVKTNVGHLEAAAGIAGLIKAILALQHEEIPAHLHVETLNPYVPWHELPVRVGTKSTPWARGNGQRCAGVSSFSFSGTNAHVVLAEAAEKQPAAPALERPIHLLSLSAKSQPALKELAQRFERNLAENPSASVADVSFTANTGRSHFSHRLAIIAESIDEARQLLKAFAAGNSAVGTFHGKVSRTSASPKVAFLFPGCGSQYTGMGWELYQTQPVFRNALIRCNDALRSHLPISLIKALYPSSGADSPLDDIRYAQVALLSLEFALTDLWRSWGIEPAVVLGHGLGEYAAACVAGVFSIEDALRLVLEQGRLIRDVAYSAPEIRIISSVTGKSIESGEVLDAQYWQRQPDASVNFAGAMQALRALEPAVLLEVGPSSTLLKTQEVLSSGDRALRLTSLEKGRADWQQVLESLGSLYTAGKSVDWIGFDRGYPRRRVILPTYPFQDERHWLHGGTLESGQPMDRVHTEHPLLGKCIRSTPWEVVFETQLSSRSIFSDHKIEGAALVPGSAFLEMGIAAAKAASSGASSTAFPVIRQLELVSALFLAEHNTPPVQITVVNPRGETPMSFQISSRRKEKVTLHARGVVHYAQNDERRVSPDEATLVEIRSRCQEVIPRDDYYQKLSDIGLQYGPNFQCIQTLYRGNRESLGWIELSDALEPESQIYELHPVLIDACLQVLGAAFTAKDASDLLVPVYIEQVQVFGRLPADLWSHASLQQPTDGTRAFVRGDVRLLDEMGHVVAEVSGVHLQPMPKTIGPRASEDPIRDWLYQLVWQQQARDTQPARPPQDDTPTPHRIAAQLEATFGTLSEQQGLAKYTELEPQLNVLCSAYVLQAIQELGWELRTGSRGPVDSVTESLGVCSRHVRLFHRMLEMLREDGILDIADSSWAIRRVPAPEEACDPEKLREALLNQYPAFKAELKLLGLGGSQLARVLRGETDPLEVLFQAGSVSNVEMLYEESPGARVYNALVAEAIQAALKALPPGRVARILEIGAGTGGTTSSVLSKLPCEVEYLFTDLSPRFIAYAKRKYRAYPFVRCETLDIERDPSTQGFRPHQFDVILAANVLHATRDVRDTLQHIQQLLTSDGMVILLEVTSPQRGLDLVFGLTEGWWKFADLDVRPHYPLLSQQKWRELLQESGFSEAAVAPYSSNGKTEYNQTVILARGPRLDEVKTAEVKPQASSRRRPWILLADARGVAQRLGTLLTLRGESCIFVNAGSVWNCSDGEHFSVRPDRLEDLEELFNVALDSGERQCAGIVHLWSLDALPTDAISESLLKSAETISCMSTVRLIQAVARVSWAKAPRLFLVTRGVQPVPDTFVAEGLAQSPLWGVGRVVFQEHPELQCAMVDLSTDPAPEEIASLAHVLVSDDPENQIALRGETRYVARLSRLSKKPQASVDRPEGLPLPSSENYHLETSAPGLLNNLVVRAASRLEPGPGQIEIQVFAASLNFRDVMIAMGLYPGATSTIFGDECSGRIVAVGEGVNRFRVGDEVVAIAPSSFSAFATTNESLVARKPISLSFEQAAAFPLVFLTACYALQHLAHLAQGERVLIHSASGGVGLAAIQVARSVGAEIYATAGSPEKREFLRSIGVQHVMDSRSLAFADEVMERTKGLGVDVVLNSLTGEAIAKGLSILAPYGRFLEIGKRALFEDTPVGLRLFQNSQSFFAIDLERLCYDRMALAGSILEEIVARFNDGTFQPLPHQTFPLSEARSAFRRMAQAKHIGKIILSPPKLGGVAQSAGVVPELGTSPNLGGELFHPNATYLITGGLGGLGLLVAEWMAEQGAGHLVLVGRSSASANAEEKLRAISATGASVVVEQADVSDRNQLAAIIDRIRNSMPSLRGVIHAAGTLDDGIILQLDEARFANVMRPKVQGAWHLHTLTADIPLDFFIMFSSAASILGPPGQANHAAANTFLDHLAHLRRRQGKPASSINWGPWAEVGAAARPDRAKRLLERGVQSMLPRQGLDILQHLMGQDSPQVAAIPMDWTRWQQQLSSDLGRWPLLSEITQPGAGAEPSVDFEEKGAVLRDVLLDLNPVEQQRELQRYLCEQIAKVLERPASDLDTEEPLNNAGLDSIMALELKNHLEIQMGLAIPMVRFLQGYSIDQLVSEILDLLAAKSEAPPATLAHAAAAGSDQGSPTGKQSTNAASMLHTDLNRVREAVDRLSETEIDSMLDELLSEQAGQE